MRTLRSGLLLIAAVLVAAPTASAQDDELGGPPDEANAPGLRFNGLGRTLIQQTDLGGQLADADTTTAEALADGEFVLDLAVNAQPNRVTEVQGILRLRNEFGGFFGSGVTVEVRELWARGIVAGAIEYRVGDMDYALTPFTVFLPEADGVVNTPEAFVPLRERVAYEEFYTGRNERRLQGGRLDFGLAFDQVVDELDVRTFIARLRATDFLDTPTRLIGGGRLGATSAAFGPLASKVGLGVNLASTWDDLDSGDANEGIRNHVVTVDGDIGVVDRPAYAVAVVGEAGTSVAKFDEVLGEGQTRDPEAGPLLRETDTFFEVGIEADLKPSGVGVSARFVNIGPDFFSAAAQSKRVDFARRPGSFNRIGNERDLRPVGLFDLSRDAALYTFRVEDRLMQYDPRFNNTLPYGRATPNRRGVHLGVDYAPEGGPLDAELLVALLSEIRGQGTTELKDFALVRASADVPVAPLIGYGRDLAVSLGTQVESTSRGGGEFETVDLTSTLFEVGLVAEVYDRLDVLLGAKTRSSSGSDYVPQVENFNDVRDFPGRFVTDDRESLLAGGLRYRFRDDVYLTVQVQQFRYGDDATPEDDYRFDQVFALYTMSF
ncbi:MAG: hypothetical protein AAGJ11_10380 [Bacteroidota bacterium]